MWNIIPRDKVFYDLFERSARNVVHGAELLAVITNDWSRLKDVTDEIREAEHEGDQIAHEALTRLDRTFVTPLDREDIFALICGMDDIIDATVITQARPSLGSAVSNAPTTINLRSTFPSGCFARRCPSAPNSLASLIASSAPRAKPCGLMKFRTPFLNA